MDFHVAGALELLVDHVVHPRAGVDQRRGDDGQRAAFLDVARRAEEALGALQRVGVDTAGQHLARRRHDRVVGAGEPRDRVEQDDHVLLVLDQPLGFFDHHLGDLHVARRRFIEGRCHHFAAHRALHFGHFFRALVDQQHDQHALGMSWRRAHARCAAASPSCRTSAANEQAALALADRRDDVDHAAGDVFLALMSRSSTSGSFGKSGVRFSNRILFLAASGGSPLTLSTLTSAK